MPDHTIVGLLGPTYEEEKLNLLNVYANYIKTPKTYTGDIEIAATAHFLGININIVINDNFIINHIGIIGAYKTPMKP